MVFQAPIWTNQLTATLPQRVQNLAIVEFMVDFQNRTVVVVKLSWDDWSWLNSFFANSARLFNMLKIFFCITIYILFFAVFCDIYYRILRISFWLMQYLCLCNNNSFHMLWKLIHDIFKNIRHHCKYFNSCKKLLLFITLSVFN